MRIVTSAALVSVSLMVVACGTSNPSQPSGASALTAAANATSPGNGKDNNGNGKPEIDPTWANGQTVYMIGPHVIENARANQPNLYAQAEELYLAVFPQNPPPTLLSGPITLLSGYQPQCNPCFHPGLPLPFVFHDHIITGAPGMGKNGTAGEFKAPWKIIIVMYDPAYANSQGFHPLTSAAALDAAEQAGGILLQINPGAANPFEIETGNVLICPIVSNKA
ncbi:MAG TPA: hypothetical protein VJN96_20785 [Vicinamibacterales bacterium]|nr:hypothetical protein [Vicinamibacterales bacterium]